LFYTEAAACGCNVEVLCGAVSLVDLSVVSGAVQARLCPGCGGLLDVVVKL
jgi:hypothetical protein